MPHGRHTGHVKHLTDLGPAAMDASFATHSSAVVGHRGHPDQAGDALAADPAKLWQIAGQYRLQARANALHRLQDSQLRLLGNLFGNLLSQAPNYPLQAADVGLQQSA
uniref:Uncharacterized protein n=1 Tax=Panagrolaimus superbus TaxID=310955 RepID=A0A914YLP2_9BILA